MELAHQLRLDREAAARERDAIVVPLIRADELTYAEIAARVGAEHTIQNIADRFGVGAGTGARARLVWARRKRRV